jgi:hypothetical protein
VTAVTAVTAKKAKGKMTQAKKFLRRVCTSERENAGENLGGDMFWRKSIILITLRILYQSRLAGVTARNATEKFGPIRISLNAPWQV